MEDKFFDTEEKRQQALLWMNELVMSHGWQLIKKLLTANIELLDKQIAEPVGIGEVKSTDDIRMVHLEGERMKLMRHYQEQVRDLPSRLIDELPKPIEKDINTDPFD